MAAPAMAQTIDISCQSSPRPMLGYDPTPAQDSLPALVRNGLAPDGDATEGLDFTVLIPGEMTPGCPAGSLEPMRGITYLGDGMFEGFVVHNSLSHHGHLFGQTLSFNTDQIWDWQLYRDDTEGRLYGAFRLRWTLAHRSVDGGAIMIQLMPTALPPDWN